MKESLLYLSATEIFVFGQYVVRRRLFFHKGEKSLLELLE